MLVDDDLHVRWHRRKLFNDFFVAADSARVELVDDWDNRSHWSLATGADLPGVE